ncbi:MAG: hypothetical protein J5643_08540 [Lachnospiraceae bacterium]|nr:hypothetical protein [Lachnospiraceae bacterium]
MKKKLGIVGIAIMAGLMLAGGICFYMFSWHDNGSSSGESITITEDLWESSYYIEKDGYRFGNDWNEPSFRGEASSTDYMREATLTVDFEIITGEYCLRIFDESGTEVFNKSFPKGKYKNVQFPLGCLGYGYSSTDKISLDYKGSGSWEITSRCKGYDKFLK